MIDLSVVVRPYPQGFGGPLQQRRTMAAAAARPAGRAIHGWKRQLLTPDVRHSIETASYEQKKELNKGY